jgi:hypothetical protein
MIAQAEKAMTSCQSHKLHLPRLIVRYSSSSEAALNFIYDR